MRQPTSEAFVVNTANLQGVTLGHASTRGRCVAGDSLQTPGQWAQTRSAATMSEQCMLEELRTILVARASGEEYTMASRTVCMLWPSSGTGPGCVGLRASV